MTNAQRRLYKATRRANRMGRILAGCPHTGRRWRRAKAWRDAFHRRNTSEAERAAYIRGLNRKPAWTSPLGE